MKQAFLAPIAQSPLLLLPLFALFLFLTVFAAWVFRTYAKRPEAYAEIAALPLFDDDMRLVRKNPTEDVREVSHVE
jgi:cbb3-type cytochrome oxidase subunit 3